MSTGPEEEQSPFPSSFSLQNESFEMNLHESLLHKTGVQPSFQTLRAAGSNRGDGKVKGKESLESSLRLQRFLSWVRMTPPKTHVIFPLSQSREFFKGLLLTLT